MEILDVVDENGLPTGETAPRDLAHARGIPHRTAHVWLLRLRENTVEVLLQKRAARKESWPGCYDISSAGHIPAGSDFIPSALRELREELGVTAEPEALIFCPGRENVWREALSGSGICPRLCPAAGSGRGGLSASAGRGRLRSLDAAGGLYPCGAEQFHSQLYLPGGTGYGSRHRTPSVSNRCLRLNPQTALYLSPLGFLLRHPGIGDCFFPDPRV